MNKYIYIYIYVIHEKYSVTLGFMKFIKVYKIYKTTFIRQLRGWNIVYIYYHYHNSSILDIEHSPFYIALGSTYNHKVIY